MEFGKLDLSELDGIEFSLPPDLENTKKHLLQYRGKFQTRIYIGCSKWGMKEWVGTVFPEGTPENEFLQHYINKFDCIELDTTFYNIQRKNVLKVAESVKGHDFKVCPKFSRRISHVKNFGEVRDITDYYVELMGQFGDNLGSCILQLPEYFAQKRLDDLKSLLQQLPENFPVSVELRNKGWFFEKDHPVFDILAENNAGAVITDTAGRRDVLHMQITNPVVIIRFVGNNLHPTDYRRMDVWVERINEWLQYQSLQEVYFFVHHDDEKYSPATVEYMAEKVQDVCGVLAQAPRFTEKGTKQ